MLQALKRELLRHELVKELKARGMSALSSLKVEWIQGTRLTEQEALTAERLDIRLIGKKSPKERRDTIHT